MQKVEKIEEYWKTQYPIDNCGLVICPGGEQLCLRKYALKDGPSGAALPNR